MMESVEAGLMAQSPLARLGKILRSAAVGAYQDDCLATAKGAAFSGLLSFFPVVTTLATLLVQARAEDASHAISAFLYEVVPPGTEDTVRALFVDHGQRPNTVLVAAVLLAVWAASGAIISLMEGFRSIYHIPSGRSFVRERAVAILLVFASIVPAWGAFALIVFGQRVEEAVVSSLGLLPEGADLTGGVLLAGQILRFGVAFGGVVLVTAMVYYIAPNRKQKFAAVVPGAFVATFLWMLATIVFAWYVRHVSNYNVLYGSVGAGLALLTWMYVLAVIMLFGCEINAASERMENAS